MNRIKSSKPNISSVDLEIAIEAKNVDDVEQLYNQDPQVLIRPFDYCSDYSDKYPIHVAVYLRCEPIIEFILTHFPAMVDQPDNVGDTPLILAVRSRSIPIAKYLISQHADVNRAFTWPPYDSGKTLLHYAIEKNRLGLAICLVNAGARLDIPYGSSQHCPIHIATLANDSEAVELLIDHDPLLLHQVDANGQTPLSLAAGNGCIDLVLFLLEQGARVQGAVLSVNEIIEAIEHHERPDDFAMAICFLIVNESWSTESFNSLIKHPRPQYLALAFSLSTAEETFSNAISHACEAHSRPLSLAFAFVKLKRSGLWTEHLIRLTFQKEYPAEFVFNLYMQNATNVIERYSPLASEFKHEQMPFSMDCYPDFSRSLAQALHYHGVFSARRSIMDIHNNNKARDHDGDGQQMVIKTGSY